MRAPRRVSAFGSESWEVDLARRELRTNGVAVPLGTRAFDIVEVLVQSAGELVTKDEIMRRVWSRAIVEESTLQVHISATRKALGPNRGLLKTAFGRGYRLTGSWTVREESPPMARVDAEPMLPRSDLPSLPNLLETSSNLVGPIGTNVPVAASALIGRISSAQHLRDLLSAYRVVTLTGPGGIGKTVLALEVARNLFPTFQGDVLLVELGSLSDPDLVAAAVTGVLGLKLGGGEISAEAVARAIGPKKLLLVLDNCEHVVDAAARLAETIVRLCPRATVLATSREILRIEGECVYRVPPLEVPPERSDNPSDVLQHSAVALFMARTKELNFDFSPVEENPSAITTICRRLDGIPLAIEFAAACAAMLGIQQVARGLDDRFRLLTTGRRTALPRHQTLRAALDWSYELLPELERCLLRRLAVFPAGFTLEAATAVMSDAGDASTAVAERIASLVAKSLLAPDGSAPSGRWRLLETIRAHALEKLAASGEAEQAARRHAEFFRDLFAAPAATAQLKSGIGDITYCVREIDNVRAALDWAFSPEGDASIGVALTAVAAPLWMRLSLLGECRSRAEQALATIGAGENRDTRQEMKVQAALGTSLYYIRGPAVAEVEAAWAKVLELAESVGDAEFRLQSLWGLWSFHLNSGRQDIALELAQKYCSLAVAESSDRLTGERMLGMVEHRHGDLRSARRHLERVLAHYEASNGQQISYLPVDFRVYTRALFARILWLQGFPDQAMRTAAKSVEQARSVSNATLFHCALSACLIALWVGDLRAAARYIEMLLDSSRNHELPLYSAFGQACQGMLAIRSGDIANGVRHLRAGLDHLGEGNSDLRFIISQLAEALGHAGRIAEGLAAIEEAIDRSDRGREHWTRAEFLRIKSELLLLDGPASAAAAEDHLRAALDWAHRQDALSWELRAATSLARILRSQGRSPDAVALLQPIYDRFSEGFDTADLKAAKALLDALE